MQSYPQYKMGGGGANGRGLGEVPSLKRRFDKAGELYTPKEHWQFMVCEELVRSNNAERIPYEPSQEEMAQAVMAKRDEFVNALMAKDYGELRSYAIGRGIKVEKTWKKNNIIDAIIEKVDSGG